MGFKIDFIVEGDSLIDDHCVPALYTQEVKVTGNSISDVVCLAQDGNTVWFTESQFEDFIEKIMNSSGNWTRKFKSY